MKILIVASNMVHINNFHRPYIQRLQKDGHQVLIMANGEGADCNVAFKKRFLSLKNLKLISQIKKHIIEIEPDVIFLHTTLAAFLVRYALKGIKNRPRVVNTVHGYLFGKGFSSLHNLVYLSCEKIVRKQTDKILVMNNEDYEIATKNKLCLEDVTKINGIGIDFARCDGVVRTESLPPKNALFVGEMSKRKNQRFLIEIMKELPSHTLTLVGDGSEREDLERLIKKQNLEGRVRICGYTKDIKPYLQDADIYLSASRVEGLPFNILEAMRVGLPIVASDIKGHSDLLPKECLCPLDKNAFVEKIKSIKKATSEYDVEKYSLSSVLEENLAHYSKEFIEKEAVKA
ncbi:MAG: glycosyltransferase [Clostridia bacterium]|nr:glycosyltransferase [Clostridia bacterium]